MSRGRKGPHMGAPRKEIDFEQFEKLCKLQPTLDEVADYFMMDVNTVNERCKEHYGTTFSVVLRQKKGKGKISLRRALWRNALENMNPTVQIWLSKQHLGMTDKQEQTISGASDKPALVINYSGEKKDDRKNDGSVDESKETKGSTD